MSRADKKRAYRLARANARAINTFSDSDQAAHRRTARFAADYGRGYCNLYNRYLCAMLGWSTCTGKAL